MKYIKSLSLRWFGNWEFT